MPYDGNLSDDKNVLPSGWRGSTALNSTIKSYEDLAYRVKAQLGFPVTDLEVTDEQIAIFIDEALEWFTQYSGREKKWLIFTDQHYVRGCGVKLNELIRTRPMESECLLSLSSTVVTGTNSIFEDIETSIPGNTVGAFLSVSPFKVPSTREPTVSAIGQEIILKFNKRRPWDALSICRADCFTIKPVNSDCYSLSSNTHLSTIDFTSLITTYPALSGLLNNPVVSADGDGVVPISALTCNVLSSIPTEWWDTSAFYASADLVGFPVTACIEISEGQGVIYPKCNRDISCNPLSSAWTIDPDFDWLSIGSTLSGEDGRVIPMSAMSMLDANAVSVPGLPICQLDQAIRLHQNGGYYMTFFMCNSSIDTGGPWPVENVQFKHIYHPPEGTLNVRFCDIDNKGFTIVKTISSHGDCIEQTPDWVPVDVLFQTRTDTPLTGCEVTTMSGGFDYDLEYRRKVIDCFEIDYTLGNGGYFGANLLFSFDYGIVANAFGYDLMGNRNLYRNGYDMLSYHMARGFIDEVRRYVNYVSYDFNPDTQYLKIIPEPFPESVNAGNNRAYVVGVYVEKPLAHLIRQKWVQEWVRARVMEAVGYIRSKFGQVTMYGGASIQGDTLVSMGREETQRLLTELRDEAYYTEPPLFFVG